MSAAFIESIVKAYQAGDADQRETLKRSYPDVIADFGRNPHIEAIQAAAAKQLNGEDLIRWGEERN